MSTQTSDLTLTGHSAGDEEGQLDLFLGDLFATASKDDIASMEHPMFSIRKGGDRAKRRYEHNGFYIEIEPSAKGSATIWDKDILIYVFTLMRQRLDRGEPVPDRFEVSAADMLRSIGRDDSGTAYSRMYDACDRLKGTTITTNLPSGLENPGEESDRTIFSLVDEIQILRNKQSKRLTRVLFKPSEWFRRQVQNERVLTIHPAYFQIEGGVERRMYELGRKHCGDQSHWQIREENLYNKIGATCEPKRFRHDLKEMFSRDGQGFIRIVDYLFYLSASHVIHVFPDTERGRANLLKEVQRAAPLN